MEKRKIILAVLLVALDGKDVLLVFPTNHKKNSTVRILKTPKTESSVRKIFLPKSVANMLVDWKAEQDEMKEILGDEYMDYNLVMASTFGLPLGDGAIRGPLKKLIEDYNLPPVVFHSFRHSSVTYKLKLNGGDIKAVQGNSGHAQVSMVTDVYSHILDDDRKKNAELFEEAFYEKKIWIRRCMYSRKIIMHLLLTSSGNLDQLFLENDGIVF